MTLFIIIFFILLLIYCYILLVPVNKNIFVHEKIKEHFIFDNENDSLKFISDKNIQFNNFVNINDECKINSIDLKNKNNNRLILKNSNEIIVNDKNLNYNDFKDIEKKINFINNETDKLTETELKYDSRVENYSFENKNQFLINRLLDVITGKSPDLKEKKNFCNSVCKYKKPENISEKEIRIIIGDSQNKSYELIINNNDNIIATLNTSQNNNNYIKEIKVRSSNSNNIMNPFKFYLCSYDSLNNSKIINILLPFNRPDQQYQHIRIDSLTGSEEKIFNSSLRIKNFFFAKFDLDFQCKNPEDS